MPKREHNGVAPSREDGRVLIEVHVAGVCIRAVNGQWKLLAAQRTKRRSLFPRMWECGGGQLRMGEDFETGIKRQIFEEFGLSVTPVHVIETYAIHIPEKQGDIPGVRLLCLANAGKVRLNTHEFSRHKWVDFPVPKLDWIGGLKEMLDRLMLPPFETSETASGPELPAPKPAKSHRPGFITASKTKAG